MKQWSQPDARLSAAKKLLTQWAIREADPKLGRAWASIGARLMVTRYFCLEEAKTPLALEILRSPERVGHEASEFACLHATKLGAKENRQLLEHLLDQTTEVFFMEKYQVNTPTQVRDLALAAIVQLSGEKPEDYGFTQMQAKATIFREAMPVYLFSSPRDRDRAFERYAKNYKELGLRTPPRFSREFTFSRYPGSILANVHTTPNGKVRLDAHGNTARLIEVATGKPIGKEISAQKPGESPQFTFACWSFSADGKHVVTGSRYYFAARSVDEKATNVGRIEVWDAATGELVQRYHKPVGSVLGVRFSDDDSMTVLFIAEKHSMESP